MVHPGFKSMHETVQGVVLVQIYTYIHELSCQVVQSGVCMSHSQPTLPQHGSHTCVDTANDPCVAGNECGYCINPLPTIRNG